jgi:(p)ppGpp synthase/HD superfamily hydrolase
MLAAALLHDTIEDCGVHQHQIDQLFGETVGTYVMWLTDNEKGNRAERKAQSRARLAAAPAEVQTIKLADLISNTASIVEHDPKFAKVYLQEKMELLSVLIKGDDWLHRRAQQQVADGLESLEQAKAA